MSDTERLINHSDAQQIIGLLEDIAEMYSHVLPIPFLTAESITYDGEDHSVTEILANYDPTRMILTGELTDESSIGDYTASVQLKYVGDTWSDGTTEIKTYAFSYVEAE